MCADDPGADYAGAGDPGADYAGAGDPGAGAHARDQQEKQKPI